MKKNIIVLHIGLGKTGTSTLQKKVLPLIAKKRNLKYWGNEYKDEDNIERKILGAELVNHEYKMKLGKRCKKIEIKDDYLISDEDLSSFRDANYMEEYAEKNLIAFGPDAHIFLSIREPRSWFTSLYIQLCVQEKPLIKPKYFFLSSDQYSERLPNAKFNYNKFGYKKLIDMYKSRFNKVTYFKYESLKDMNFLKDVFQLNEEEHKQIKDLYSKNKVNRSLGKYSIKILNKFSLLMALFGIHFISKYSNEVILDRANENYVHSMRTKKEKRNFKSFILKSINNILNYKFLFQKVLDNLLPYEKMSVNFEEIKDLDINMLADEYSSLDEWKTYTKS
tara:strand:+ start:1396 stop:2400 length:1005 start_codon:yes stop_codon:yes gene_type:complete